MPGRPSRRTVLRRGLVGLGIGTAGCSALGLGGPPDLSLVLLNFTDETRRFRVEFYREDRSNRDDAHVFTEEYEVSPDRGSSPVDENILPSRRYLVRVTSVHDHAVTAHYHYYPEGCTGDDEPPEELYVEYNRYPEDDPRDGFHFEFDQNRC